MSGEPRHRARRLAVACVLALACALAGASGASAQVSPGPLSEAHRFLDGPLQCLQCHAKGKGKAGMDARCLACHTEVAWMKTRGRGLHASAAVSAKTCTACHPEHGGRTFRMVLWEEGSPARFDHRRAGWPLQGAHAALSCEKCHTRAFQKSPALAAPAGKRHAARWIGLETSCLSCHADPHREQLGSSCVKCHDQVKWKPVPGFDHAATSYALTGAHARVECAACHATPAVSHGVDAKGQPIPQWKPLAHAECSACHRDPHAGRLGNACAQCHVTASFHQIVRGTFAHDKTRYPLHGAHAAVACAACHDPKAGSGARLKFARCDDCHRDAHHGQATLAGRAQDCAACHDVRAFRPSTYSVAQHQLSVYPLEGAHARVECAQCHVKRPQDPALGSAHVALRPAHAACTACHADPHAGRFSPGGPRARAAGCVACHTLERFRPSSYDDRAHTAATFQLEGAHRAVACQECHAELKAAPARSTLANAAAGMPALRFEQAARACTDCHVDPHRGQFARRGERGTCQSCHGLATFIPATAFDHDRDAEFALEGAHARTACGRCHARVPDAKGALYVRYRPTPTACEACHG